ncbi:MAG TPA: hypothetical protein VFG85_12990 [Gaiellaceae bacterium]|jgi:hypothetical protein|nr:hypothetical protein [Gaiellaceae bacterium]
MSTDVSQFDPLHPPTRRRKLWLLLAGPLIWVVALEAVAIVMHRSDLIGIGLLIAGSSGVLGLVLLALGRRGRLREEREDAPFR